MKSPNGFDSRWSGGEPYTHDVDSGVVRCWSDSTEHRHARLTIAFDPRRAPPGHPTPANGSHPNARELGPRSEGDTPIEPDDDSEGHTSAPPEGRAPPARASSIRGGVNPPRPAGSLAWCALWRARGDKSGGRERRSTRFRRSSDAHGDGVGVRAVARQNRTAMARSRPVRDEINARRIVGRER
jgi:hypothetical protein